MKNDEPAYLPILNAAVSAMKVEFITNLEKYETNPDRVGNHRHFFPNKVSGQFRAAIENCYVIAAANANNTKSTSEHEQEKAQSQKSSTGTSATKQQNELDLFARDLLEAWKDLVQFIFLPPKDVRGAEKPVPIDLANWVADDLLFRMRGKKNTGYESFVRRRGLVFKGVIDEVRTTLGNTVPLNKAVLDFKRSSKQSQQQTSTATSSKADQQRQQQQQDKIDNQNNNNSDVALQEEINRVGQKAKIPSIYSFSDYGSDASLDSKSAQNIPSPTTQSTDESGFEEASSPPPTTNNQRHHYNDNNTNHHHQDHKRYHRQDQHFHHQHRNHSNDKNNNNNNRSSSGHKVPIYKQIIKNQREENARIAQILQSIFSASLTGDSVTKTISLHALYEICRAHDAIRPPKFQKSSQQKINTNNNEDDDDYDNDDNQSTTTNNFDERTHRQFSKRIFEIVQRGLVPDCHLAVTDTSVLNMTALIADNIVTPGKNDVLRPSVSSGNSNKSSSALAFPSAPVTTIAGEKSSPLSSVSTETLQQQQQQQQQQQPPQKSPSSSNNNNNDFITLRSPIIVHDDPQYDPYFNILVHLLYTNFHIKPNKAKGIVPDVPYSGHNICCVVVERQGKIVGMDFNQCKQDQNLCSHAEKRLGEALNEKLKKTVPPNTPPSLEEYTFISSLEPCHMCCNFISRLGVKTIAYLQADPMQCDALNIAASLLGLKVVRPSVRGSRFIAETMETAFKLSDFPEEEITSWLGSAECRKLLGELKQRASFPEGSECDKFMKKCGDRYPGVVVIDKPAWNSNNMNSSSSPNKKEDNNKNNNDKTSLNKDDRPNIIGSNENDDEDEDGEDMTEFGMIYSTSSVLAGIYGSSSTEDEEEAPNSEEDDS